MKEVNITDNHKIPRKYRKGFKFYIDMSWGLQTPSCSGANWVSKNKYHTVFAFDKEIPKYEFVAQISEHGFEVKENYVRLKAKDGQEDMRP